jgi:hypothetical protein
MSSKQRTQTFKYLPLTIRLDTLGGVATPIVPRGTPLPTKRIETFSSAADAQSVVEVNLWIGERSLAKDNVRIGSLKLGDLPPAPRGTPSIVIEVEVDEHFGVTASARLDGSTLRVEQSFQPPMQLTAAVVTKMLTAAEANAEADERAVRSVEARNRAADLIAQGEQKLRQEANGELSRAIASLGLALQSNDVERIRTDTAVLSGLLAPSFVPGLGSFADLFGSPFGSSAGRSASARSKPPGRPTQTPSQTPTQTPTQSSALASAKPDFYVNEARIAELRASTTAKFDLRRLVALCEELNVANQHHLVHAVGMLTRAIVDHVPPLFECAKFSEVANNYPGSKSFKDAMAHLDNTSRKIADSFLHVQVRNREALPNMTQVDFRNAVDMLLQEVVRIHR